MLSSKVIRALLCARRESLGTRLKAGCGDVNTSLCAQTKNIIQHMHLHVYTSTSITYANVHCKVTDMHVGIKLLPDYTV